MGISMMIRMRDDENGTASLAGPVFFPRTFLFLSHSFLRATTTKSWGEREKGISVGIVAG